MNEKQNKMCIRAHQERGVFTQIFCADVTHEGSIYKGVGFAVCYIPPHITAVWCQSERTPQLNISIWTNC